MCLVSIPQQRSAGHVDSSLRDTADLTAAAVTPKQRKERPFGRGRYHYDDPFRDLRFRSVLTVSSVPATKILVDRCLWSGVAPRRTLNRCNGCRKMRRRAFTLLETIVSIGILAILLGLVLPAVQRAREIARSARCLSNLRQIGIALHSYDTSHTVWPSGWVLANPWRATDNGWGWLAMLLPYLDRRDVYNELNLELPVWAPANRTAREQRIESLLCPSDRYVGPVPFVALGTGSDGTPLPPVLRAHLPASTRKGSPADLRLLYLMGPSSYVGVFGPRDPDDVAYQPRSEGTFFLNSAISSRHLVDGTSNTAIVGERVSYRLPGVWAGMDPREYEGPERVVGFGAHAPLDPMADEAEFSSRHPGVVNFLMGDGSARRISASVAAEVMRALTTRAGGERLSY